jgi:hypothetical protein
MTAERTRCSLFYRVRVLSRSRIFNWKALVKYHNLKREQREKRENAVSF